MSNYDSLLIPPSEEKKQREKLVQIDTRKPPAKNKKMLERGCEFCPSNHKKGINKVKGKVRGRDIFIWGMAPGRQENREEKEFVGASGKFLWDELEKVGITRKDCDIQNVVRCFPATREDGKLIMRDPSKEEFHCCSIYTDKALEQSKAKIHIVLGTKAAEQLLGKEYKKTRKIYWSEKLNAKVYCMYHPSYFVRGVYPKEALKEFRNNVEQIAGELKNKQGVSRYGYLEQQDYEAITTIKRAIEVKREIIFDATRRGIRTSIDLEEDTVDGKRQDLCVGFSNKIGTARVFVTGHPKVKKVNGKWQGLKTKVVKKMRRIVKSLIEDKRVEKIAHHGCYDGPAFKRLLDAFLHGFNFDTEFSEYLKDPNARSFGLNAIALRHYPQFVDYKHIIMPRAFPKDVSEEQMKKFDIKLDNPESMYNFCKKTGSMRLAQLPLKLLTIYNGADCDLTKRIEVRTKKHVNLTLLRIYTDASFILAKMEPNGPAFDFQHHEKLTRLYPVKLEECLDKIKQIAGSRGKVKLLNVKTGELEKRVLWDTKEKKEFNPGSPQQVSALLYDILEIKFPFPATDRKGKKQSQRGTGKKVLEILQLKHPIAKLLMEYRRLSKMVSTYLNSYAECAKNNGGLLRTSWWLTGTATGRMSSGGGRGDEKGNTKQINLQNIHGDENLKNQIVADPKWRKLYAAIRRAVRRSIGTSTLRTIDKLNFAISRLPGHLKNKAKKLKDKLESAQKLLVKQLSKSIRFKRLTRKILAGTLGAVMVMLGYDQGQIEVRMMAQASGDKNLLKDCKSGDIHSKVGHAMTGWSVKKIKYDKKTRTLTKNVHFGIMFGLVPEGLLEFVKGKDPETKLTLKRVTELYNNYFRRYAGVRRFMLKMRAFVEAHGYVENMFGFVRPLGKQPVVESFGEGFDEADTSEESGGAFWGNQAINTPIQGAAHCLMFMAMAIMKRRAKKYKKLVPTLEVHDYMGFKSPIRDIFKNFKLGKYLLEKEPLKLIKREYKKIKWKIPLVVEGNVGFRYGDSVEADGKQMHELLAEMFCETYTKESKLDYDLELVA